MKVEKVSVDEVKKILPAKTKYAAIDDHVRNVIKEQSCIRVTVDNPEEARNLARAIPRKREFRNAVKTWADGKAVYVCKKGVI